METIVGFYFDQKNNGKTLVIYHSITRIVQKRSDTSNVIARKEETNTGKHSVAAAASGAPLREGIVGLPRRHRSRGAMTSRSTAGELLISMVWDFSRKIVIRFRSPRNSTDS